MRSTLGLLRITIPMVVVSILGIVAAACGAASTPNPTAAPENTKAAPTARPVQLGSGEELFISKSCAACHGQKGEGSAVAPALPGHTEEQVIRQVRNPIRSMPAFSTDSISDDELKAIAEYIEGLASGGLHLEPSALATDDVIAMHHWMVLSALRAGSVAEAEHHLQHAANLVEDPEHRQSLDTAIESLKSGNVHDAEHHVESVLAGMAAPELSMQELHLQLALSALSSHGVADAEHHIGHFMDEASSTEVGAAQAVLDSLTAGKVSAAEAMTKEILEGKPHQQHRH